MLVIHIMGGTVKENDLGVTINAHTKVSKQCISAAYRGNQALGMIRKIIITYYKENGLIVPLY